MRETTGGVFTPLDGTQPIPMLWNEATTDERRRLLGTLIEMVYVDLKTKHVTAVKPTPAFKALFGVCIDTGPGTPVELQTLYKKSEDLKSKDVGVGGDGGELVST